MSEVALTANPFFVLLELAYKTWKEEGKRLTSLLRKPCEPMTTWERRAHRREDELNELRDDCRRCAVNLTRFAPEEVERRLTAFVGPVLEMLFWQMTPEREWEGNPNPHCHESGMQYLREKYTRMTEGWEEVRMLGVWADGAQNGRTEKAPKKKGAKRDPKMEARNKWIYEELCRRREKTYEAILAAFKKEAKDKGWAVFTTINRLRQIGSEYAAQNGLTPPPARQGF